MPEPQPTLAIIAGQIERLDAQLTRTEDAIRVLKSAVLRLDATTTAALDEWRAMNAQLARKWTMRESET